MGRLPRGWPLPRGGPTNLDEAFALASWLPVAIATGAVDPRQASEIGKALEKFLRVAKARDQDAELKALRRAVEALERDKRRAS